jgi:hypothetical protein
MSKNISKFGYSNQEKTNSLKKHHEEVVRKQSIGVGHLVWMTSVVWEYIYSCPWNGTYRTTMWELGRLGPNCQQNEIGWFCSSAQCTIDQNIAQYLTWRV